MDRIYKLINQTKVVISCSGPAPQGDIPGPCPPKRLLVPHQTKIVPPQARTVPRRNYQARGHWSANRGPNWCLPAVFLWTDTRFHNIFGMNTFFFGGHLFSAGKTVWIFGFGRKIPLTFSEDVFFFGGHLFSAGKTVLISDFGRKIPLSFWSSPCSFDPDWDKFLVPPCPSRIHINKLLVPPQNLFLPPQSRYPGAGPAPAT